MISSDIKYIPKRLAGLGSIPGLNTVSSIYNGDGTYTFTEALQSGTQIIYIWAVDPSVFKIISINGNI